MAAKKSSSLKGVILENTFTSIADMVDALMPTVAMFKTFIQRVFYPTVERIDKITCPLLIVRGEKDEIVPANHSEVLFAKAKGASFKEMYSCPEGNHNMTW